jgi:hypothetical protein
VFARGTALTAQPATSVWGRVGQRRQCGASGHPTPVHSAIKLTGLGKGEDWDIKQHVHCSGFTIKAQESYCPGRKPFSVSRKSRWRKPLPELHLPAHLALDFCSLEKAFSRSYLLSSLLPLAHLCFFPFNNLPVKRIEWEEAVKSASRLDNAG